MSSSVPEATPDHPSSGSKPTVTFKEAKYGLMRCHLPMTTEPMPPDKSSPWTGELCLTLPKTEKFKKQLIHYMLSKKNSLENGEAKSFKRGLYLCSNTNKSPDYGFGCFWGVDPSDPEKFVMYWVERLDIPPGEVEPEGLAAEVENWRELYWSNPGAEDV
ncbi:hypothetical protein IAQ61_000185 [Plenodomus lingam]|uniref:uncharacterized protein n=1 Tax=Leptosphaeria maculans TaxID=5022 RepID=UPI00331C768B|nr:hypothetical protein IAQ61_000185 [Plenodomus lingam]